MLSSFVCVVHCMVVIYILILDSYLIVVTGPLVIAVFNYTEYSFLSCINKVLIIIVIAISITKRTLNT